MEEIFSILKYLATSNAINFIIMLVILGWILKKINLGKSFAEAIECVKNSINKSVEELNQANKKLEHSQSLLKKMPSEIKDLEDNSQNKIKVFKDQIENNTNKTILELEKNIDNVLKLEEQKISNVLTDKTSIDSVELAKQHLVNLLKENPQLHEQFIQKSLNELDKVNLK